MNPAEGLIRSAFWMSRGFWVSLLLIYGSVSDLRKKSLSATYLIVCGWICIVLFMFRCFSEGFGNVWGILPGGILLLVSRLSDGCIGMADALILMMLGPVYGLHDTLTIVLIAFLLAGLVSIVLIAGKRAGRKSRLPFYPFVLLGFMLCRCMAAV